MPPVGHAVVWGNGDPDPGRGQMRARLEGEVRMARWNYEAMKALNEGKRVTPEMLGAQQDKGKAAASDWSQAMAMARGHDSDAVSAARKAMTAVNDDLNLLLVMQRMAPQAPFSEIALQAAKEALDRGEAELAPIEERDAAQAKAIKTGPAADKLAKLNREISAKNALMEPYGRADITARRTYKAIGDYMNGVRTSAAEIAAMRREMEDLWAQISSGPSDKPGKFEASKRFNLLQQQAEDLDALLRIQSAQVTYTGSDLEDAKQKAYAAFHAYDSLERDLTELHRKVNAVTFGAGDTAR
jgi:hypothetical protein